MQGLNTFRIVTKELKRTEENGYRDVLKEVYASKVRPKNVSNFHKIAFIKLT